MGLKSLFIKPLEESGGTPKKTASTMPSQVRPSSAGSQGPVPPPPTRSSPLLQLDMDTPRTSRTAQTVSVPLTREPDPVFLGELREALSQAQRRGFDEFVSQLDVIDDDVKDRPTAIKMTLKSLAKTLKIPTEEVIASMRERVSLLESAKAKFESDLATESQQATTDRRQAVENAQRTITSIDDQIRKLQVQRSEAERNMEVAQRNENDLASKVANVRARYESAYDMLLRELSQTLNEVQQIHGA